jgi:hypothetical protein
MRLDRESPRPDQAARHARFRASPARQSVGGDSRRPAKPVFSTRASMRVANLIAAMLILPAAAQASNYEFLAAPQINLSLVYRLDKLTGEIIACQYGHNPGKTDIEPGAFGVTVCYRAGEGAGKLEPGEYGLVATRHEQEGGVFRVDFRTGSLSICYLYFQREKQGDREIIADQYVVCTPPVK